MEVREGKKEKERREARQGETGEWEGWERKNAPSNLPRGSPDSSNQHKSSFAHSPYPGSVLPQVPTQFGPIQ
jgi:hypothetical protein